MAEARVLSQAERLAVGTAPLALPAIQTRKSPTEAPQVEVVPDARRAFAPRRQPQPVEMHHASRQFPGRSEFRSTQHVQDRATFLHRTLAHGNP